MPDTFDNRRASARACRGLGALLLSESTQAALAWAQRGLDALAGAQVEETITLQLLLADIYTALGDDAQAEHALNTALSLIPAAARTLRISALSKLSNLARLEGNHSQAAAVGQEAIRLAEQSHDQLALGVLWGNLAIDQIYLGEWAASLASHHKALGLAKQLGNVAEQIRLTGNLGSLYRDLGDDETVHDYLLTALEQARAHKTLRENVLYIQCTLADFHLRRNEVGSAVVALEDATQLAADLAIKPLLPYIESFWALAYLAQGQIELAAAAVAKGLALARELDYAHPIAICLRTKGQVLLAQGECEAALDSFARSADLLTDDPFEGARTKLEWARALITSGDRVHARRLLTETSLIFERLDAQREMVIARGMLLAEQE